MEKDATQPLTAFQADAAAAAARKMFAGSMFLVGDLDSLARLLGRDLSGKDYEALRALNCAKWASFSDDMRTRVQDKCLELLALELPEEPAQPSEIALRVSEMRQEMQGEKDG